MTLAEQLREFNEWRRGGDFSQPNPRELGVLIDKSADRLEQAEKLIAELESALSNTANMDVKGFALIDRLQFSPKGRELMSQINDTLASAKAWKKGT